MDGTRFLKVKFTEQVTSLPYSTRFNTSEGMEYFRVIHDKQVRVCRVCIQSGHVLRECPDFLCRKCGKQGHYARECSVSICRDCRIEKANCKCNEEQEPLMGEEAEEPELAEVGGEMQSSDESGEEVRDEQPSQPESTPADDSQAPPESQQPSEMGSSLDQHYPEEYQSQKLYSQEGRRAEAGEASASSTLKRGDPKGSVATDSSGAGGEVSAEYNAFFSTNVAAEGGMGTEHEGEKEETEVLEGLVERWKSIKSARMTAKKRTTERKVEGIKKPRKGKKT